MHISKKSEHLLSLPQEEGNCLHLSSPTARPKTWRSANGTLAREHKVHVKPVPNTKASQETPQIFRCKTGMLLNCCLPHLEASITPGNGCCQVTGLHLQEGTVIFSDTVQ